MSGIITETAVPEIPAEPTPRVAPRSGWTLLLGALVSGAALLLLVRSVDLNQTWDALKSSNPLLFVLAFGAQLLATEATMQRWQILLRPYPTRFRTLTQIYFIAHLFNTVLPAKLGTVARVLLAAESEHLNLGFVVGSVAIEKVLDSLLMVALLGVLAPFVPLPLWLRQSLIVTVLIVIVGLALVASIGRLREPLLAGLARLETRLLGPNSKRLENLARGMVENITNLTKRREIVSVLIWTAAVWIIGGAVNELLFAAVGIHLPWSAAWFVIVVLQIGTRVPALPANLGLFHYLVVLALGVYGVNESAALAFAILLHLIVFILPALIGAVCAVPVAARLSALVASSRKRSGAGG